MLFKTSDLKAVFWKAGCSLSGTMQTALQNPIRIFCLNNSVWMSK